MNFEKKRNINYKKTCRHTMQPRFLHQKNKLTGVPYVDLFIALSKHMS